MLRRALRAIAKDRETDWWFTTIVAVVYLGFLIWMHAHHELWRDEIHSWTLSRLSDGFGDLVTGDRRYEGHPPLWFWYLRLWSRLSPDIQLLHIATVVAAMAAALVLLRYAPFPRYVKVLLLGSYYFGYEYTVLSRNYVLGWLLVCLFCATYHRLRFRYLALGVLLGLLSLTSVYGLIMAVALLVFTVLDRAILRIDRSALPATATVSARAALLATIAGAVVLIVFCLLYLEPADPNIFAQKWNFAALKLAAVPKMMLRLVNGFLPWRRFSREFWSSYTLVWDKDDKRVPYIGGALLLATLLALVRSWRLLIAYLAGIAVMAFVQQTRYEGHPRHLGHYFMMFLVACWLLRVVSPRRRHWPSLVVLVVLLAIQVQGLVASAVSDTRHVFAGGAETAAFIRGQNLQDLPIVAGDSFRVLSVTGYLRRPFINVENEEVHETVVFHMRRRPFSAPLLVSRSVDIARERGGPVLMIATRDLPAPPSPASSELLFTSHPSTINDEVFRVYLVRASK